MKGLVQGDERDDDQFFLDTLLIGNIEKADEWHAVIRCNETRVKVKLDTGAASKVIPLGTLIKVTPIPHIKPSNTVLRACGGQRVTHIGMCQLECSVNGRNKQCDCYIVISESPPILGILMCENIGLITRGVKGVEAITTVPVKEPPRRVPFGLQDRLKLKLDLMEKHKVMIVEKKDGSLRLCPDPRELNKAIKRENFLIPTVENVTCRLNGKKVFTVIDLKDAF